MHTALKQHQIDGLRWLRDAWNAGRPGVLLADDMGLGKTLQALAFLALLREAMRARQIPQRPILIVAPTGLLANWRREHDLHLSGEGLGRVVHAYGAGLAALRMPGTRTLNRVELNRAEWVLTTYETMRDNQIELGDIPFAAITFDEAQRIKTPSVRVTDAAKSMNADFVIAMTGTPVENRLADIWCIVDRVQPLFLGDLKTFSARYEAAPDEVTLRTLKAKLERKLGGAPGLMIRRLKREQLDGLPTKSENEVREPMPPIQAGVYGSALAAARSSSTPGARLQALQRLRLLSLHPDPAMEGADEAYIAASARLRACFSILDQVQRLGEKALVFCEFLDMQARMAGLVQRRFGLRHAPVLINGAVSGELRQRHVNEFQVSDAGFNVMILSPRAGGVGITVTAANHVVHLTRWWNPAVEDQCTDRVYRIGQVRPVTVHLPMAVLPGARTFDQTLHELLHRKRTLAQDLLAAPAGDDKADTEALFAGTVGE